jgi:uncharacterized membrane protein YkvI
LALALFQSTGKRQTNEAEQGCLGALLEHRANRQNVESTRKILRRGREKMKTIYIFTRLIIPVLILLLLGFGFGNAITTNQPALGLIIVTIVMALLFANFCFEILFENLKEIQEATK